jgi:hypothetical protein
MQPQLIDQPATGIATITTFRRAAGFARGSTPIAQFGGSARGYEGLSARLPISTTDEQAGGPGHMFMHGQR